jgi:sodium transport system ATP-binding protein
MIEAKDLCKRFGRIAAVDHLTFTATDGAITTLLGGNGCGKTTTLRMICGLNRPDAGAVLVNGLEVGAHRVAALKTLGVLHDEFGLYARLTVREHLRFSAQLQGLSGRALHAAVERTVELLELGSLAERRTHGFSHGQRIKVALARALVHGPKNVILDEPTRGLDVFSVRMLRSILRRLRDEGACVLMSSHALAEVTELSDHVVVIDGGRVHAAGTPAALMANTGSENLEAAFVTLVTDRAGKEVLQ